jgi:hypothetical protein
MQSIVQLKNYVSARIRAYSQRCPLETRAFAKSHLLGAVQQHAVSSPIETDVRKFNKCRAVQDVYVFVPRSMTVVHFIICEEQN